MSKDIGNELRIDPSAFLVRFDAIDQRHYLGGASCYHNSLCPSCGRPLFVYISLDLGDPALKGRFPHIRAPHRFEILFCPRCEISWGDFRYKLDTATNRVEVLSFGRGPDIEGLEESLLADHFAKSGVKLEVLPSSIQALYLARLKRKLNTDEIEQIASFTGSYANPEVGSYPVARAQCQLFGVPFFQQLPRFPLSTHGRRMEFLASFAWAPQHLAFPILPATVQLVVWYEPLDGEILTETVI